MEGITATELLIGLHIGVAVMLIVILYHILFIVVSVRKMTQSSQHVTKKVEDVVLKPLAMVEGIFAAISSATDEKKKK